MADKNELMALCGMSGETAFKVGKIPEPSPRLRLWMANENFYPTVNRSIMISASCDLMITYPAVKTLANGYRYLANKTETVKIPAALFVSIFFTPNNYECVAEILSDDIGDAFDLTNNPHYGERWHELAHTRSFSVGDVVELVKDGESEFFFCAPFGWEKIYRAMSGSSDKIIDPKEWRGE